MEDTLFFIVLLHILALTGTSAENAENYAWIPYDLNAYTGHATLQTHNNKTMELFWVVNDIPYMNASEKQVEFLLASKNGPTWLGFGVSQTGGMIGADLVVGRKNSQGQLTIARMFASGFVEPVEQDKLDVELVKGVQDDTRTIFVFKRPLVANCQSSQQLNIHLTKPDWFIFALGASNTFGKHPPGNVGQMLLDMSSQYFGSMKQVDRNSTGLLDFKDETVTILELTTETFVIPPQDTVYCYTYYSFEDLEKMHIIAEEPIIKTHLLHHMAAYFCDGPLPDGYNGITANSRQNTCNRGTTNPREYCYRSYLIWAVGEKGRVYPKVMGKPIGQGPQNTIHLLLEYHYNNPTSASGVVDTGSGMRLYLTQPRTYDVGVMFLGAMPQDPGTIQTMPPIKSGNSSFMTSFECPSRCTSDPKFGIPSDGINVLNSMMHMHHYGRSGYTRIIRNGTEIEPITNMKYFDFNFQNYNYVPKSTKVYPSDRLITTCRWDASDATSDVLGGYSSQQEMCINWIEYYPAVPMYWCGELVPPSGAGGLYMCLKPGTGSPLKNFLLKLKSDTPSFVRYNATCLNQQFLSNLTVDSDIPSLTSTAPSTPSTTTSSSTQSSSSMQGHAHGTDNPSNPTNSNTPVIVGCSVAAGVLAMAFSGVAVHLVRKRRHQKSNPILSGAPDKS